MGLRTFSSEALAGFLDDMESQHILFYLPAKWEEKSLSVRLDAGELVRPMPGMYARASYWASLNRREKMLHVVHTLSIQHPTWVFSHSAAALAHGLEVPYALYWPIHYVTGRSGGGKAQRLMCHHRAERCESEMVNGIRVTPVDQTVVDCARTYAFRHALAQADSALRLGLTTKPGLIARLDQCQNRRNVRRAQGLLVAADPRPENGGESVIRAIMMEQGLPIPELQYPIPNPEDSRHVYRADFVFDVRGEYLVDMELDGYDKYDDPTVTRGRTALQVQMEERQREAGITAHGIRVVRFGFWQAANVGFLLRRLALYGVVPQEEGE